MLTDIEIAQQTKLIPIDQLAHEYGLSDDQFIPYGRDKAKVALDTSNAKGKLILVTATSGMPALGPERQRLPLPLLRPLRNSAKKHVWL